MSIFSKKEKLPQYQLKDVFGIQEKVPANCPTFLEREVHKKFKQAINCYNIVVVYGESRQGKTWTIEKYCENQLRIGCQSSSTVQMLKEEMLAALGISVHEMEQKCTEEKILTTDSSGEATGGFSVSNSIICKQSVNVQGTKLKKIQNSTKIINEQTKLIPSSTYTNTGAFYTLVSDKSQGKFFVLDNFHYLSSNVQQEFCALLKELNYHEIKIIIVGVWKHASKITALATDLGTRCAHIDMGLWKEEEIGEVLSLGEKALNIEIDPSVKSGIISSFFSNIGIFKAFMQTYCSSCDVICTATGDFPQNVANDYKPIIEEMCKEAFEPLRDRIVNLASPQKKKSPALLIRLRIVLVTLKILLKSDTTLMEHGIAYDLIKQEVKKVGRKNIENISNLKSELERIHEREENKGVKTNFIPLFFFDLTNNKLLILEPTLYMLKVNSPELIEKIITELQAEIK